MAKGKGFDLVDLKSQLEQLQKMGGVGVAAGQAAAAAMKGGAMPPDQGDKDVRRQIAIINSMTRKERRNPDIIDGSRRRRIAAGAGRAGAGREPPAEAVPGDAEDDEELAGGKLQRMMQAFKGGMPPGFPGATREAAPRRPSGRKRRPSGRFPGLAEAGRPREIRNARFALPLSH